MTTRIGAAIAAGFLAIGILVGAAGTIVIGDAADPDHMSDMAGMMANGDRAGMMSMMGDGHMDAMMGAGSPMSPGASMSPDEHGSHHVTASPEATR
jgi:hypothetical protein